MSELNGLATEFIMNSSAFLGGESIIYVHPLPLSWRKRTTGCCDLSNGLTTEEADRIIGAQKRIIDDIQWKKNGKIFQFEVDVFCDDGTLGLTLKGTLSISLYSPKLPSLSLMYRSKDPVRMLHWKRHHNPDCQNIDSPHKNYWTTEYRWHMAYHIDEIQDKMRSRDIIFAFLEECNIKLEGRYQDLVW